jgi:hypothetical protein
VQIAAGNYTRQSFAEYLSTRLTTVSAASGVGNTYTVTNPSRRALPDTGKYVFTAVAASGYAPVIITNSRSAPAAQLGFETSTANTMTLVSGTTFTIDSTRVIKMQLEDQLFIRSDIANNGVGASIGANNNILAEVFSNGPDLSSLVYRVADFGGPIAQRRVLTNANSNVFTFAITDDLGDTLDLNGCNSIITILVFDLERYAART